MYRKLSGPLAVQLELTSFCNHKCIHCYNYWRGDSCQKPDYFSAQDQDKIVSEIIKNQIFDVCLTGGEPLAVIEHYVSSLKKLYDSGITLNINSNMSLMNQSKADLFQEIGIRGALVSIVSGDKKIHDDITGVVGSFDRVTQGVSLAASNNIGISVSMVCTKKNLHTIRQTAQLAKDLGAKSFCIAKASWPLWRQDFKEYSLNREDVLRMFEDTIWVYDNLKLMVDTLVPYPLCGFTSNRQKELLGNRGCGAGRNSAMIGFSGQLRPCPESEENYGSIIVNDLKLAWDAMNHYRSDELIPEFCRKNCDAFPYHCQGGCRVDAKNTCGSITSEDPMCTRKIIINKPDCRSRSIETSNPQFFLNKNVRFRKEEFGYIAYFSHLSWVPIDELCYNLLIGDNPFGVPEVCSALKATEIDANNTLGLLLDKQIIIQE